MTRFAFLIAAYCFCAVLFVGVSNAQACSTASSSQGGVCFECTAITGCGWCADTMECLPGTEDGPDESGLCPNAVAGFLLAQGWAFGAGASSTCDDMCLLSDLTGDSCFDCVTYPSCLRCQTSSANTFCQARAARGKFNLANNSVNLLFIQVNFLPQEVIEQRRLLATRCRHRCRTAMRSARSLRQQTTPAWQLVIYALPLTFPSAAAGARQVDSALLAIRKDLVWIRRKTVPHPGFSPRSCARTQIRFVRVGFIMIFWI